MFVQSSSVVTASTSDLKARSTLVTATVSPRSTASHSRFPSGLCFHGFAPETSSSTYKPARGMPESAANSYTDRAISTLIGGAPSALDTLNELAAALGSDAIFSTTIATALGNRVRVDEAQSFNATQKTQGRDNIGAASASDVGDVAAANFVTTFEAALV
jgi:hypothetical protein